MRSYTEYFDEDEGEDILFEMSNLVPENTGLEYIVWIIPKNNREKHGPRIKVNINNILIPVSVNDNPQVMVNTDKQIPDFNNLQKWIVLNKDILLQYWDSKGTMSMRTVLDGIKKL